MGKFYRVYGLDKNKNIRGTKHLGFTKDKEYALKFFNECLNTAKNGVIYKFIEYEVSKNNDLKITNIIIKKAQ